MTFAAVVAAQMGNVFACRTDRESIFRAGLLSNPHVWLGIAAELASCWRSSSCPLSGTCSGWLRWHSGSGQS